jgi:hypothetical protein
MAHRGWGSGWRVDLVEAGAVPVWRISCKKCAGISVLCRTDEAQAIAWAENHHVTTQTTVKVSWPDCRPSAAWVPSAISDCVLTGALRVPGVVGADTGYGFSWATKIYGKVETIELAWLEQAIRAEFTASPYTFGTDELRVEPLTADRYRVSEVASEYTKYVAWRTRPERALHPQREEERVRVRRR